MRAIGRIRTLRATATLPRLTATARMTQGQLAPRAQVGLVSQAVEVHDPSGILTVAEDLPGGAGVRLGVSGLAGTADPETGATLSVPLRDVAGREIGPLHLRHLPSIAGTIAAQHLTPWATGAGNAFWVGLSCGPFAASTERAIVWLCQSDAPGVQRVGSRVLQPSGWRPPSMAQAGHATIRGPETALALLNANGQLYGIARTAPISSPRLNSHAYWTHDLSSLQVAEGDELHLIFGAGGPTADQIDIHAIAAVIDIAAHSLQEW